MAEHEAESPVSTSELMEEVCERENTPSASPVWLRRSGLDHPNRRVRDPYARWCGRRGAARRPPIPIPEVGDCRYISLSPASGDPSTPRPGRSASNDIRVPTRPCAGETPAPQEEDIVVRPSRPHELDVILCSIGPKGPGRLRMTAIRLLREAEL